MGFVKILRKRIDDLYIKPLEIARVAGDEGTVVGEDYGGDEGVHDGAVESLLAGLRGDFAVDEDGFFIERQDAARELFGELAFEPISEIVAFRTGIAHEETLRDFSHRDDGEVKFLDVLAAQPIHAPLVGARFAPFAYDVGVEDEQAH